VVIGTLSHTLSRGGSLCFLGDEMAYRAAPRFQVMLDRPTT